ncbi:hypothetical protein SASPL_102086 [Salvia splendens]|uniref:Uncharacterized protein n=1 Tax=Salvia splendens TaxID=180675 RepID=A0A8X8YQK1_SALSN|nr:hypothetical protein SASPL_102086 [Salvia splendens]
MYVTSVKPIYSETMPKALPVMPSIPAAPSPRLNAIAIILAINPITFIPPTHVIVINPTATTFPLMKLALIDIPIGVCLNITPGNGLLIRLLPRTNRPKHRKMRPAHPALGIYLNRQGLGKEQPNRGEPRDCYCGGGGGGNGGAGGEGGGGNRLRISEQIGSLEGGGLGGKRVILLQLLLILIVDEDLEGGSGPKRGRRRQIGLREMWVFLGEGGRGEGRGGVGLKSEEMPLHSQRGGGDDVRRG